MDISIYNSIRGSKVSVGNVPQLQSTRIFSDSGLVCPNRSNISDSGVIGVARDSINTYTAGCNSPLSRIVVENVLRPKYSSYLNVESGLSGVGADEFAVGYDHATQNAPYYDTMLGNGLVRNVEDQRKLRPRYDLATMPLMQGVIDSGDQDFIRSQQQFNAIALGRHENRSIRSYNN